MAWWHCTMKKRNSLSNTQPLNTSALFSRCNLEIALVRLGGKHQRQANNTLLKVSQQVTQTTGIKRAVYITTKSCSGPPFPFHTDQLWDFCNGQDSTKCSLQFFLPYHILHSQWCQHQTIQTLRNNGIPLWPRKQKHRWNARKAMMMPEPDSIRPSESEPKRHTGMLCIATRWDDWYNDTRTTKIHR